MNDTICAADTNARKLLLDFYLSNSFDPKAPRHADTVEAAIGFTLDSSGAVVGELVSALGDALTEVNALRGWIESEVSKDAVSGEGWERLQKPIVTALVTSNARAALRRASNITRTGEA